jgi:zinc transport system substrate-binding protein
MGCAGSQTENADSPRESPGEAVVVVTNYPVAYFARRIGGSLFDVRTPFPSDRDPAYWRPTEQDVTALQRADLVLLNGASYERWLEVVSLAPSKLVDTTAAVSDRFLAGGHGLSHSHGPEGQHEHPATAFTTWLDPTLATEQARRIAKAFASRRPEHAAELESRLAELTRELASLDTEIQAIVASRPDLPLLFSHPVYQYLQARYHLNGRSLHWEPDAMPDDAQWQDLERLVAEHPARWIIWEVSPRQDVAARLAARGIESVVFDPCATAPEQGDYMSVMRTNRDALRRVFASP